MHHCERLVCSAVTASVANRFVAVPCGLQLQPLLHGAGR